MNRHTILYAFIGLVAAALVVFFGYRWYTKRFMPSNKIEQTLVIIKPDAVRSHYTGKIIDRIEQEGFTILDLRKVYLEREQAEKFYEAHKGKSFYHQLVDYMTSGPVVVMVLEKLNAITDWRDLMGATDPAKAKEGSIRKQFGTDIGKNAVHGSDSSAAAATEIKFFFADRIKE
jgi:nucleoside-diphosphate kinase